MSHSIDHDGTLRIVASFIEKADYTVSDFTPSDLTALQARYADLVIQFGVNLQPGQGLNITAELAHAPFVRVVTAAAYRAGAKHVHVHWVDTLIQRAALLNGSDTARTYVPDYEITRHRQMVDEQWARLAITGAEFPDGLEDVDPTLIREAAVPRRRALRFYSDAMMANQIQWCVIAVPTAAWAAKVFPDLPADAAQEKLWETILQVCRVDQPDPVAAWQLHNDRLSTVADFLNRNGIRLLHFHDPAPGPDGKPSTDLTLGLTQYPNWIAAASQRPDGVEFLPNMPTEEVFCTPDNRRADGWVRTSKPGFPFERRVEDAWFRFAAGELVDYSAGIGEEVLGQLFEMDGAKRLGEVALVDVRSPINQAGIIFFDTLFDENAVCHIAFGEAYPGGVVGGDDMAREELDALGVNQSDTHVDLMIGTPTMNVTGRTADGVEIPVMENGRFVPEIVPGADTN